MDCRLPLRALLLAVCCSKVILLPHISVSFNQQGAVHGDKADIFSRNCSWNRIPINDLGTDLLRCHRTGPWTVRIVGSSSFLQDVSLCDVSGRSQRLSALQSWVHGLVNTSVFDLTIRRTSAHQGGMDLEVLVRLPSLPILHSTDDIILSMCRRTQSLDLYKSTVSSSRPPVSGGSNGDMQQRVNQNYNNPCGCDPKGTQSVRGQPVCLNGKCTCLDMFDGPRCDQCAAGRFRRALGNSFHCDNCECSMLGTVSQSPEACDPGSGQCVCRPYVDGRQCSSCLPGFFNLDKGDHLGCQACQCNPGGSRSNSCDLKSGECSCLRNVIGRKCDRMALKPVYLPDLHHLRTEFEDGYTVDGTQVLISSNSEDFLDFSGTGYVRSTQKVVLVMEIQIPLSQHYQLVLSYTFTRHNLSEHAKALVQLSTAGSNNVSHSAEVHFAPRFPWIKKKPQFAMALISKSQAAEFKLTEGNWTLRLTMDHPDVLMDFAAFVPEDYSLGVPLSLVQTFDCSVFGPQSSPCRWMAHNDLPSASDGVVLVEAENGHSLDWLTYRTSRVKLFDDADIMSQVQASGGALAKLFLRQTSFTLTVPFTRPGLYIIIVQYLNPVESSDRLDLLYGLDKRSASMPVLPCPYRFLCRGVFQMKNSSVFHLSIVNVSKVAFQISASADSFIGVDFLAFIPAHLFRYSLLLPRFHCLHLAGHCLAGNYLPIPGVAQIWPPSSRSGEVKVVGRHPMTKGLLHSLDITESNQNWKFIVDHNNSLAYNMSVEVTITSAGMAPSRVHFSIDTCLSVYGCRMEVSVPYLTSGRAALALNVSDHKFIKSLYLVLSDQVMPYHLVPHYPHHMEAFKRRCILSEWQLRQGLDQHCLDSLFTLATYFAEEVPDCNCSPEGSIRAYCYNIGGRCSCVPRVGGRRCDRCLSGYYDFPHCKPCDCNPDGSVRSDGCSHKGDCSCKKNIGGQHCDKCLSPQYFDFPNCKACNCHPQGSLSMFCDGKTGQCQCRQQYTGLKCDRCFLGHVGFPACTDCGCNRPGLAATKHDPSGCLLNGIKGQCRCKKNVHGKSCDRCRPLFYNLSELDPDGCRSCDCDPAGTRSGLRSCDTTTGQCDCKLFVTGRRCDRCKDGFYMLNRSNALGCQPCSCLVGGSVNSSCDAVTGRCYCRPTMKGIRCGRPSPGYFMPLLYHIRGEVELAQHHDDHVVFHDNKNLFPGFRGDGVLEIRSPSKGVIIDMDVPRSSSFKLLARYSTARPVVLQLTISPVADVKEVSFLKFMANLTAVTLPAYSILTKGSVRLRGGKVTIRVQVSSGSLLLDNLVLLPEEYITAKFLEDQNHDEPCIPGSNSTSPCTKYGHAPIGRSYNFTRIPPSWLPSVPSTQLQTANTQLSRTLVSRQYSTLLPRGQYVLVIQHSLQSDSELSVLVDLAVQEGTRELVSSRAFVEGCVLVGGCRNAFLSNDGTIFIFTVVSVMSSVLVQLRSFAEVHHTTSLYAVPYEHWSSELLNVYPICVSLGNAPCGKTAYEPVDASGLVLSMSSGHAGNLGHRVQHVRVSRFGRVSNFSFDPLGVPYRVILHYRLQRSLKSIVQVHLGSIEGADIGEANAEYCPSSWGCRTPVYDPVDPSRVLEFPLTKAPVSALVTLTTNTDLELIAVIMIPVGANSERLFRARSLIATERFAAYCASAGFHLKEAAAPDCQRAISAVTVGYLGRSLACNCNNLGTRPSGCAPIGGACSCRPLVSGERCDRCIPGFGGFPSCRPLRSNSFSR